MKIRVFLFFILFNYSFGELSLEPELSDLNNVDKRSDKDEGTFKRVCIFPNWSILRDSNIAQIFPEDVDPFLCTHIHYAYANIDIRNMQLTPSQYQDYNHGDHGEPFYSRIMKLKDRNPKLKVLISIGGWFAKSVPFNRILQTDSSRSQFIENMMNFLRHWRFDGLEISWQFPGAVDSGAAVGSKEKFTNFIRYIARAFRDEEKKNFKKYLLSAFVSGDENRVDDGYEVKSICKHFSYISVATYDYTSSLETRTGYNAPLYSHGQDTNNVNASIHSWLERGCPANKLLVGIPTYARVFRIPQKTNAVNMLHLGIKAEPYLNPSLYTNEEGVLSYYEVCELISNKEAKVYWDDVALVPFAILSDFKTKLKNISLNTNIWMSFEDSRSARKKAEYVKQMSLGGVSMWSLDMDDFKGLFCNLGSYPIIDAVKQELEGVLIDANISITTKKYETVGIKINTTIAQVKKKIELKPTPTTKKPIQKNEQIVVKNIKKFKPLRKIRLTATLNRHKRLLTNNSFNLKFSIFLILLLSLGSNLLIIM